MINAWSRKSEGKRTAVLGTKTGFVFLHLDKYDEYAF